MSKWLKRLALALPALPALVFATGWWLLHGSLPKLDGQRTLSGLSAPATIQRDNLGVVTIDAANETDAVRALGYVHAQERFFEMDLMRRTAAGELAELFGPIAVDTDRQHRIHRMRARVTRDLAVIAGGQMGELRAYVDGVNAGLAGMRIRPWPYLLLRAHPRQWQTVDSPLVGEAMYFDLQDGADKRELAMWKIRNVVPPALYALLAHDGSSWDAPLVGASRGDAVLPDAATLDLRKLAKPGIPRALTALAPPPRDIGSNNFAVAGALTRDGRAIVADDMHLHLRVPALWFRVRLRYADAAAPKGRVDISGFSLPGLPLIIVGSNGHVAWGFTNSYGDWADWKKAPACVPFDACAGNTVHHERILVAGDDPIDFEVRETPWGPVLHTQPDGSTLSLRWAAHLPNGLNLSLADLARARNVRDVFDVATRSSIPAQNLMVADASGHIGWRILGALPQRDGGCDRLVTVARMTPSQYGTDCRPWPMATGQMPQIADPASHRLWTANNRSVDDDALQGIGDGGYALGARAMQIRDDLSARRQFDEHDLLAIQLDDRALFLQRWWRLLQDTSAHARTPALRDLASAAAHWDGRASVGSTSYRIVRSWRLAVHARLLDGLTAPAQAALGDGFLMPDLPQFEGVAWPLVTQRPVNLLGRRFASWDALFEDAAIEVRDDLANQGPLAQRTWGERNTAHICHPLSMALPGFAKRLLCMPFDPLDGDSNMPRVTAPDFGASERMVVSPGHEAEGIIEMPGGQSGHPLSPYWGGGHEEWVNGRATPFLPGKPEHTLHLVPARG